MTKDAFAVAGRFIVVLVGLLIGLSCAREKPISTMAGPESSELRHPATSQASPASPESLVAQLNDDQITWRILWSLEKKGNQRPSIIVAPNPASATLYDHVALADRNLIVPLLQDARNDPKRRIAAVYALSRLEPAADNLGPLQAHPPRLNSPLDYVFHETPIRMTPSYVSFTGEPGERMQVYECRARIAPAELFDPAFLWIGVTPDPIAPNMTPEELAAQLSNDKVEWIVQWWTDRPGPFELDVQIDSTSGSGDLFNQIMDADREVMKGLLFEAMKDPDKFVAAQYACWRCSLYPRFPDDSPMPTLEKPPTEPFTCRFWGLTVELTPYTFERGIVCPGGVFDQHHYQPKIDPAQFPKLRERYRKVLEKKPMPANRFERNPFLESN